MIALSVIPLFSAGYTFVFAFSRQMFAMSRSGLLPIALSLTSATGTPYVSTMFGSLIGFAITAMIRYYVNPPLALTYIYNMMVIAALLNYMY